MELKERVKNLLKKYNLCDTCLGRQFHELYPRRGNESIGKGLRKLCPEYEKKGKCYLCNDIFENLDKIVEKVKKKLENYEFKTFLVGSKFPGELISREEEIWEENGVEFCEAIKTNFNKVVGVKLKKLLKKKIKFENPDIMVIVDLSNNKAELQVAPLYIEGGYKKLLPKSKVQKIIENVFLKKSCSKDIDFYSVGRLEENVITSCYRPFVIKLKNPRKRRVGLEKIKEEINRKGLIKLGKLKYSDRKSLEKLRGSWEISYFIVLQLRGKINKLELKRKLNSLENKRIYQVLRGKLRKPKINKIKVSFENNKIILNLQVTENFSVNSFLTKSKPNLAELLGKFKVKEIVIKKYIKSNIKLW
jgi:tRNA pseudouridine synthase 10